MIEAYQAQTSGGRGPAFADGARAERARIVALLQTKYDAAAPVFARVQGASTFPDADTELGELTGRVAVLRELLDELGANASAERG